MFILTRNKKIGLSCTKGEIIFEFKRPTNEDLNNLTAAKMEIADDKLVVRLNAMDRLRIAFYDQFIEAVYFLKDDGTREDVADEDKKPILPKDFSDDVKKEAVLLAFEVGSMRPKN